jgi:hypothetical protein
MNRGLVRALLAIAALLLLATAAFAQEGQITGTVRDSSGAVMPGVTVEVTSPALIERLRSGVTDSVGQYRITNLPVGTYLVTFTLSGFKKEERSDIVLTSGFTASVNATMAVGQLTETVVVSGATPVVDVQNAREVINLPGEVVRELPTSRNVNSLLEVAPGITNRYKPTTAFGAPGVCVGGIGVFCNPGIDGFNVGDAGTATDTSNLNQGRVMVDGQVVNQAGSLPLGGMTGGYTADVTNAQEINIKVSGALGESETGGSEINIVPRTGGNRYSGNFNGTYTTAKWFFANNGDYPTLNLLQPIKSDHDVTGAFGGPIMKDRLWFYSVGRDQGISKVPGPSGFFWPNLNEGKAGYNYVPDITKPSVSYINKWRNANARITWQASAKNKFNFFWDEQDFCQDPCEGVVSVFTSPESWFSVGIKPNRLRQASWTNPLTSKILLEAGMSVNTEFYDTSHHRQYTNPVSIPRIIENGDTAGLYDPNQPGVNASTGALQRVNPFAGAPGFGLTSGSLNSELSAGGAETRDTRTWRSRASIAYVTGGHHAKFGYDGGYYTQLQQNVSNIPQITYNYTWPGLAPNCLGPAVGGMTPCGNTSLQFPGDPFNTARRPVPVSFNFNTGLAGPLDDHVKYIALYAQDQWTFRRITASYALRYDHATSGYGSTCVPSNKFVIAPYCTPATDGVNYNDLTPRWGVTWDVRGNGKTSVKWNMGKYNNAAGINGVYSGANPARRTVNNLQRNWTDLNNDRVVNCDPMNFNPNGECGTFIFPNNDTVRFGRDPLGLDAAGTPIGLATVQCGRTESGILPAVQSYCNQYGQSVLSGWGNRRGEWQFGLGIQHELLPRLSAEVVYNRRTYFNVLVSDQLGIGCDRFGAGDIRACQDAMLAYHSTTYDFYTVTAPLDPRLPNGGGYTILGSNDIKPTTTTSCPGNPASGTCTVQTYMPELQYTWNGVDTNFNWRAPLGIRVQGGTDTARTQRDTCYATVDQPNVRGRVGAEYLAGCRTQTPWQTTVKGSASYTIPKIDILVATVFQSLPGVEITANLTADKSQVVWNADSAGRATLPCALASNGVGCFIGGNSRTTVTVPLLLNQEMWGQRVTEWDVKLAKNIRFAGKRLMIGIDCYNFFNSDAVTAYNSTYTPGPNNPWMTPTTLIAPRFIRGQIQFDF